jgi:hypothetical protein
MEFHICIPVWHKQYYTKFVETMIPSLLAPGNIPALLERHKVIFHLLIPEHDLLECHGHPSIQMLGRMVDMKVEFIGDRPPPPRFRVPFRRYPEGDEGLTHRDLMNYAHKRFVDFLPADEGSVLCIWNADLVFSDGWCRTACKMLEEGKTMIAATPFCMVEETATPVLKRCTRDDGAVLSVTPRELVALAMTDPHPFIRFQTWGKEHWVSECVYPLNWEVPGNGWISHQFCHAPLAFRLDKVRTRKHRGTMDLSYFLDATESMADVGFFQDSDDGFCAELITYKDLHCPVVYDDGRSWTVDYLLDLYAWTDDRNIFAPPAIQGAAFKIPMRYHCRDLDNDWRRTETEAGIIVREILERLPAHTERYRRQTRTPRPPFPVPRDES